MQAKENQTKASFTKEIASILKKNYCPNTNLYSNYSDLPNHIMNEIINISKEHQNRNINRQIGLSTFDETCKYIGNNSGDFAILTLEIYGIDFLGQHFGQNAIYAVLKKIIDVVFKNIKSEDKCYQKEDGRLVFVIADTNMNKSSLWINKMISAINSTMVFTHNHLFTVKTNHDIFYAQNSKEAKKYLLK